jgi:uncharacterized protein YecE (DUF72 family)
LKPLIGFSRRWPIAMISWETATSSSSSVGGEPTVAEKYDYLYGPEELGELAARARRLHRRARQVAVTFNNNNEDFPTQNALDLKRLLGLEAPDLAAARAAWRPARRPSASRPAAELDFWDDDEEGRDMSRGART